MCSHYQGLKDRDRFRRRFGVEPPDDMGRHDLWPGYLGTFIRRHPHASVGDDAVPPREALPGLFGLVPHWSVDSRITRFTYNARSESMVSQPSFRDAWRWQQRCIIPADAFFEPDWRSGQAVPTCITRVDGEPMGIAGLWSAWQSPKGEKILSFSMLTINASAHPLMRLFHQPADEKRMVVILQDECYDAWLNADPAHSSDLLRPFPADMLVASTAQKTIW